MSRAAAGTPGLPSDPGSGLEMNTECPVAWPWLLTKEIDSCRSGGEPRAFESPHLLELHVNLHPVLIRI